MNDHIVLLKALADPTRLKILKFLLIEELCVCELQELLQISQPAVSQHIARLRTAGLVKDRRAGMWTFYQADLARLQSDLGGFSRFLELDPANVPEMADEVKRRATLNRVEVCGDADGG